MSVAQKASKYYVRGVRFINCQNIAVVDCEVSHCADWHLSFEKCARIHVSSCAITGDGDQRPGGRDGVHFLDSSDIAVHDIDAMTGDDCVAFTVESGICENVVVENVRGRSAIGSVLIFNEERDAISNFRNIAVNGIFASAQVRDVVRVQAINPGTKISDVAIQNVKGASRNHGLFLAHANGVKVSSVDVTSANQNGVYCVGIDNLVLSQIKGTTLNKAFDGIHVQNCTNVRCTDLTSSSGGDGIAFIDNQNVVLSTSDSSMSATGGLDVKKRIPPSLQKAKFVQNNGLRFVGKTSN
jgi:polygalacturonase